MGCCQICFGNLVDVVEKVMTSVFCNVGVAGSLPMALVHSLFHGVEKLRKRSVVAVKLVCECGRGLLECSETGSERKVVRVGGIVEISDWCWWDGCSAATSWVVGDEKLYLLLLQLVLLCQLSDKVGKGSELRVGICLDGGVVIFHGGRFECDFFFGASDASGAARKNGLLAEGTGVTLRWAHNLRERCVSGDNNVYLD